ncbi:uncharacterized protein LOC110462680 [Mizuhopecten yessoensis]|uniref:uncharacterized protein LOC110462680 n=1 Tax=Mizuhopecten yessoensis TaxID=6573 RepID=UPI000B45D200|nr:uncharacterized protein LOC110462680 [Mizuhopecten yessoensis]
MQKLDPLSAGQKYNERVLSWTTTPQIISRTPADQGSKESGPVPNQSVSRTPEDQRLNKNRLGPKESVSGTTADQRSKKPGPPLQQSVSRTPGVGRSKEPVNVSTDRTSLALNTQYKGEDILQREARLDTAQKIGAAQHKQIRQIIQNNLKDVDAESLGRMPVEEISEIYHRYVNTLQFFCPRKDMLGGVAWGWHVCKGFSSNGKCLIYLITDEKKEDASLTYDIDQVYNCGRKQIRTRAIRKEIQSLDADTPVTNALAQKERVDLLLIEGDGSDDIVTGLLRRNALRHVDQLSVVFNAVNNVTSVSNYATQILLLKALHIEGFRIFSFERDPKHIFTDNPWRTGGYTLNMMRERGVHSPMVIPKPNKMATMTLLQLASTYLR